MNLENIQNRLAPLAFTLLRVSTGVIMIAHGWDKLIDIPKWTGYFVGMGIPFPELSIHFAIAGEFLGGIGLLLGALTRLASLGVFFTMAVAVSQVHFGNGLLAKNNGFEYPLTLMLVALYFVIMGGGRFSVDRLLMNKFGKPFQKVWKWFPKIKTTNQSQELA